jgi:NIMA (never in mitosis gene a)-related kinase 1/4/5
MTQLNHYGMILTCIIMEFADDSDLLQKIAERKKTFNYYNETEIWSIFIQTVKGLKALHELNILHRDMKVYQSIEC